MSRFTSLHLFAGACGDLIASEMAGGQPIFGANHWTEAVATADRNFPTVDYAIGDLAVLDPKKLGLRGKVDVIYASPECDGMSSARTHADARRDLARYDGPDAPASGIQRSRATMWCPIAFADAIQPNAVIMENVVEVASWKPLACGDWTAEWNRIGYHVTATCLNSAVVGSAPQSRDRIYLVAYRHGLPQPDLEFEPRSYCWQCQNVVAGIRQWKPAASKRIGPLGVPVGKYGSQYVYVCGAGCHDDKSRPAVVSPFITPAWTAIDWSLPAATIGDRERAGRALKPKTIARIERGMIKYGWKSGPQMVPLDRLDSGKDTRPLWLPAFTKTARQDTGLAIPPGFQVTLRGTNQPLGLEDPLNTVAASGNHNAIVVMNNAHNVPRHVCEPVGAVTGGNRHYLAEHPGQRPELVVQVGGNTFERPGYARAWSTRQPMPTLTANADKALAYAPTEPGEALAVANFGGHGNGHVRDTLTEPLGTITAGGQHGVMRVPPQALLASYYGGGDVFRDVAEDPASTLTGVDRYALAQRGADIDVRDVRFRMIEPHENQKVMALDRRLVPQPDGSFKEVPFELAGSSKRNNTKLAGNGITPDIEAMITDRLMQACAA